MKKVESVPQKINYDNYTFNLHFKTDYCCSMTVIDTVSKAKYENKNIQFSKMQQNTIMAILEKKSTKQLSCKMFSIRSPQSCIIIEFTANFDFVPSFSQKVVLYQVINPSLCPPQKMPKQKYTQFKKTIAQLQESLLDQRQKDEELQVLQIGALTFSRNQAESDRLIVICLAVNVSLLILWISYFEFLKVLVMVIIFNYGLYWYSCRYKFLITQFDLKKGTYQIDLSGHICASGINNNNQKFQIILSKDSFSSDTKTFYTKGMSGYPYPYSISFIVKVEQKQRHYTLQLRKYVQFGPATIANQIILINRISTSQPKKM